MVKTRFYGKELAIFLAFPREVLGGSYRYQGFNEVANFSHLAPEFVHVYMLKYSYDYCTCMHVHTSIHTKIGVMNTSLPCHS